MSFLKKLVIGLILLLAGVLIGVWFTPTFSFGEKKVDQESTVLLEKINLVTKLITVEGQLSEIYNYKDYYSYDISPLRKKALVRVNAKVAVGYDFDKIGISVKPHLKKVIITNFPDPEILSIDHDLDYYDVTEGFFNEFSPEDYNKINNEAKQQILNSASNSELLRSAEDRKQDLIDMIEALLFGTGYELEFASGEQPKTLIR